MQKSVLLLLLLFGTLACRSVEKVAVQRSASIDSVAQDVPIPGYIMDTFACYMDSLVVEDDRIRVRILPAEVQDVPSQSAKVPKQGMADVPKVPPKKYRVIAEIKPDTASVKVAEKTITETTTITKYERKLPWWGAAIIGCLAGFVLVLLVARRIGGR